MSDTKEALERMAQVGEKADERTPEQPGAKPGDYKSGGQSHGGQK